MTLMMRHHPNPSKWYIQFYDPKDSYPQSNQPLTLSSLSELKIHSQKQCLTIQTGFCPWIPYPKHLKLLKVKLDIEINSSKPQIYIPLRWLPNQALSFWVLSLVSIVVLRWMRLPMSLVPCQMDQHSASGLPFWFVTYLGFSRPPNKFWAEIINLWPGTVTVLFGSKVKNR